MKNIIFGLILGTLTCCQLKKNPDKQVQSRKVIVKEYSIFDSLRNSNELWLEKKIFTNRIEYLYRENGLSDSLVNYEIVHFRQSNSLKYHNEFFTLTSTKVLSVNNKTYKIFKYSIDSDIPDNDENIFIIEDYGLLTIRSVDWGNYLTFSDEQKNIKLVIDSLLDDDTGFFKYHKKATPNNGEQP